MKTRILHIYCDHVDDFIYAGDHRGILFKLNKELQIVEFSHNSINSSGIHILTANEQNLYARDTAGNLLVFARANLAEERLILTEHYNSGDVVNKPAMPTPSNGLLIFNDELIITNARGELIVLDINDYSLKRTFCFNQDAFNECINVEGSSHMVSDCLGYIWHGNLINGQFSKLFRADYGNVHHLVYDRQHSRYLATTDTCNGICIFSEDGEQIQYLTVTNDDVEWLAFTNDYTQLFIACFDHYLYVYENKLTPLFMKKIGPFKFQLKQVIVDQANQIFVLLESGEIFKVSADLEIYEKFIFGTDAIWYLEASKTNRNDLVASLESGRVAIYKVLTNTINQVHITKSFNFGRIRRTIEIKDGYVAITSLGYVFKFNLDNHVLWTFFRAGIWRDISLSPNEEQAVVCNENGELFMLNLNDGSVINKVTFAKPLWAVNYFNTDIILVGTRSNCSESLKQTCAEVQAQSFLYKLRAMDLTVIDKKTAEGNFKRIRKLSEHQALINGNGTILVSILEVDSFTFAPKYHQWLLNTPEDAHLHASNVYVATYGYQLNTYDQKTYEIVDSQFTTEDYPKTIAIIPEYRKLVVGGRGFISLYDISEQIPSLMQIIML
jgi:hypothetical protein